MIENINLSQLLEKVLNISFLEVILTSNSAILSDEISKSSMRYPCCLFIGEQLYAIVKLIIMMTTNFITYVFYLYWYCSVVFYFESK